MSATSPQQDRILRWPEVQHRTGICRSYAHQLAAKGEFPRPIKLGERASGWSERQVQEWIDRRLSGDSGAERVYAPFERP